MYKPTGLKPLSTQKYLTNVRLQPLQITCINLSDSPRRKNNSFHKDLNRPSRSVHFLELPLEILYNVVQNLEVSSIAMLSSVCKDLYEVCGKEFIWKEIACNISTNISKSDTETWKQYYRRITDWTWDPIRKSDNLRISIDSRCIYRVGNEGKNPIALASLPLSKSRSYYEVTIENIGEWIAIGAATAKGIKYESNNVLGLQVGLFNCSYHMQDNGCLITRNDIVHGLPQIKKGDTIGVELNLNHMILRFYRNRRIVGQIDISESRYSSYFRKEGKSLYPAVNLSKGCKVWLNSATKPPKTQVLQLNLKQIKKS